MRKVIRDEVALIAPFGPLERAHREDALAWIDSGASLTFDAQEFHSVRWFHFSEAPVTRSDPHLGRFLRKLALTSRSPRPRAMA
jgi:hypothetical protein